MPIFIYGAISNFLVNNTMHKLLRKNAKLLSARRGVCTWSPLATAFNTRPRGNVTIGLAKGNVGLFHRPQLTSSEGFYRLKEETTTNAYNLIQEATDGASNRCMVDVFDELSDSLCKVADLAEFIRIAHPKQNYREAAEDACIFVSGIVEKLNTHKPLYDALKHSLQTGHSGDEHVARLFLFDFEQSGIHLEEGPRRQVVDLTETILQTGQRFMAGTSKPREIPRNLVPSNIQQVYGGSGENLLITGLYSDSPEPAVRELAYRVYLAPDNKQDILLTHLLGARREMAELCGFESYAHRAIKASTMETPEMVSEFLNILSDNLRERATIDFNKMLNMKLKESPSSKSLACWDTPYYSQKAKKDWLHMVNRDLSSYFSLGACMDGLNMLLQVLYGITLQNEEMEPGEAWAYDIHKLAVVHETEGVLGHIYCDFYERANKPFQDCHFTIQGGKQLKDGSYQNPIVVVMLSLPSGHWNGPALLSPGSVDNLFHEMGHALHSMLGRPKFQHVSGTRCPTDLAEVPSVLMECFSNDPRVVRSFAKNYKTQEPMPEDLIQRLLASKNLFSASEMQLQLFYSVLDQQYHAQKSNYVSTFDVLKETQQQYYGLPYVENTAWQHRFSHLVGYGSKYYSYLISKALARTIWSDYFKDDPLSRAAGEHLRHGLLKFGGSKPASTLLEDFLGKAVTPASLASALAEELDCHKDQIDRICRINNIN